MACTRVELGRKVMQNPLLSKLAFLLLEQVQKQLQSSVEVDSNRVDDARLAASTQNANAAPITTTFNQSAMQVLNSDEKEHKSSKKHREHKKK